MGVFRTKFVTENVEQHRENVEQHRERERERERLKTLLYTLNFHKTFATLQNGSVDPKKLQSPKFICTIH